MGFESGGMSFRVYEATGQLTPDSLAQFQKTALPDIRTLHDDAITGWVSPDHLLDRDITEEKALRGNYMVLTLSKAQRKIPSSYLRAECKIREKAEMARRGVNFLNRADRAEIKRDTIAELLPTMPPTLTGIPCVFRLTDPFAVIEAMTDKRQDAIAAGFKNATGYDLVAWTPQHASLRLRGFDTEHLEPACFSDEADASQMAPDIGLDFMTWLWFYWEAKGGLVKASPLPDAEQYATMLEGPLTFYLEGEGAHQAVLSEGEPLLSSEAKTALVGGKKLCAAKFSVAFGNGTWECRVDARTFAFRGLKVPKSDAKEPGEQFQARMEMLQTFLGVFWELYGMFLDIRKDEEEWKKTVDEMKTWISEREAKA